LNSEGAKGAAIGKATAKMGVKFNKLEFLKWLLRVFVDFCFQRKGSVMNIVAFVKILLP